MNINKGRQTGSSMVEILVAVFVLAAGLLGLASLQMMSLKNINNAQFHTLATTYAYDMSERMRSNRDGLAGYDNILSTVVDPGCSPCTPTDMAQLDGFQWNQIIQSAVINGGLPGGQGTVTRNGTLYDITVTWNEQQRTATGGQVGNTSFTLSIQI
jgi:type IV pilus assembly protein PilV